MIEWAWAVLFGLSVLGIVGTVIHAQKADYHGAGMATGMMLYYVLIPAAVITALGWLISWLIPG